MKKISIAKPDIGPREIKYVNQVVKSGWVSSIGKFIEKFEKDFAKYCERKFAVTTPNGTCALHLALLALDIKQGDEVIVPNLTFAATANAVIHTGAKPILVDIDRETWNMDYKKLSTLINSRTKAIIVVHLYGNPCEMKEIEIIAKKHNIFIVEDAAEAHGSTYKGKKCGSFGNISCFSFYGNKTITTGEGGMCLTNDKKLYERMNLLKHHGMTPGKEYNKKYWHDIVGYNYRITNLQAALGCAQLERINTFLKKKEKNATLYRKLLNKISWITFQKIKDHNKSNYWLFTVLINKKSKHSRYKIIKTLEKNRIETRNMFFPLSRMNPYKQKNGLDVSIAISNMGISLPSHTKLSEKEIKRICKILCEI